MGDEAVGGRIMGFEKQRIQRMQKPVCFASQGEQLRPVRPALGGAADQQANSRSDGRGGGDTAAQLAQEAAARLRQPRSRDGIGWQYICAGG